MVVGIAQIDLRFAVEHIEITAQQHGEYIADGRERAADAQGVALETVDFNEQIVVIVAAGLKQGAVYGFNMLVIGVGDEKVIVYQAVDKGIGHEVDIFLADVVSVAGQMLAYVIKQANGGVVER